MNTENALQGRLEFLNLGEILQLIGANGATGMLRIISPYTQQPGVVYFIKGNIVDAVSPAAVGLEAAYELFGWLEGRFEFIRKETLNITRRIQSNRMEIILDGLQRLDDGLTPKLGDPALQPASLIQHDDNVPLIKGALVDYTYVVDEEPYAAGVNFAKENSYGEWIWVILEGVVDIVKHTPRGPLVVMRLGSGAVIGNLFSAFSFESNIRTVSAVAATDVQLGVLDTMRVARELSPVSFNFKKLLLSLENRKRQVIENAVQLYTHSASTRAPADAIHPNWNASTAVIAQGRTDPAFLQITAGNVDIVRHTHKASLLLAHLGPGDFIGQVPLWDIGHEPQFAAAYATPDCQTNRLDPHEYMAEYERLPVFLRNMIENIAVSIPLVTRRLCELQA